MASLDTKAAKGELFQKLGGLKVEARCLDGAGWISTEGATITGQGQRGIIPGKLLNPQKIIQALQW